MKKWWKKFIAWMRCEDADGKSAYDGNPLGIPPFRYSERIKYFPVHGKIGKEDILQLSHKLENGEYETCYVTIKQLEDALAAIDHQ